MDPGVSKLKRCPDLKVKCVYSKLPYRCWTSRWECPSLSVPKEPSPEGSAAGCSDCCAGPFGLYCIPLAVLEVASWLLWMSRACWGTGESSKSAHPQAGSLLSEYLFVLQHVLLMHCLECIIYSAKQVSSVSSFYLSSGWQNGHAGCLNDLTEGIFY